MLKKLLLLICIPSISYANNQNVLNCGYDNLYKTACSINDVTLAENEPFQMDFEVSYAYDCQGHNFEVGVETETGFYPFKRGKGTQTVVATGQARLFTKALNPAALYPKVLQKSCVLEVKDIKKRPSIQMLLNWQVQSEAQIKILYAELDNFQLAKNLEDIGNWNKQKLFLMKKSIQKVVKLYPNNPHFQMILNTIQKTIDNTPIIQISTETKETLVNYYKNKLQEELTASNELLELFKNWQVEFKADLDEAVLNVKNYIK